MTQAATAVKKKEWDTTLLPVMKCVLGKKGIEQRQANEVDKMKVSWTWSWALLPVMCSSLSAPDT